MSLAYVKGVMGAGVDPARFCGCYLFIISIFCLGCAMLATKKLLPVIQSLSERLAYPIEWKKHKHC